MKSLHLSPPLLILVMGYPGSGKSFFARQFSEEYGAARISEDRVRFELFAEPTFNADETEIISSILSYMAEQLMRTGSTIICDASLLRTTERRKYLELAKKNHYRTLTVWLQTDTETASTRARKRDRRNPDSKYSFDLTQTVFEQLKTQLERPGEKEPAVVISGKHAFKSQSLTVLRKIAQIYSEDIVKATANTPRTPVAPRRVLDQPSRKYIQ